MCNSHNRRIEHAWQVDWQQWVDTTPVVSDPPQPLELAWVLGEPVFCRRCTALIRKCLSSLDDLMALRAAAADGFQAAGHKDPVRSSRSSASPSPAQDDLDELVRWLADAEAKYRSSQGWPTMPYRGVNAPALTGALAWLGTHLDAMLRLPDLAEEFGLGVLVRYRTLQTKTSTRPPAYRKPLPCPRCTRFSLFWHEDETVRCHGRDPDCGRIMTASEYDRLEAEADTSLC